MKGELFQEKLRGDPFWMLVACILVNRTRWRGRADRVFADLRRTYVTPVELGRANINELYRLVGSLGLAHGRSAYVRNLARLWTVWSHRMTYSDVLALPGCGKYAADSWAIFVESRRDVRPTDRELIGYLERTAMG